MEHEAAHLGEGQPKPVLGKHHFETVAEGSKEFDRYLKRTLRAGDDEIAMRDQWRNDHYLEADNTRPSSRRPFPNASSSRTAAPAVTDSSESETSVGSESESEEDEDGNVKPAAEGGIAHPDAGPDADEDDISPADIKKFLRLQKLMRKDKRR